MCDLAHAVLLERWEDDARAATASGRRDEPIEASRDELSKRLLHGSNAPLAHLPAEERELRRALGVA